MGFWVNPDPARPVADHFICNHALIIWKRNQSKEQLSLTKMNIRTFMFSTLITEKSGFEWTHVEEIVYDCLR